MSDYITTAINLILLLFIIPSLWEIGKMYRKTTMEYLAIKKWQTEMSAYMDELENSDDADDELWPSKKEYSEIIMINDKTRKLLSNEWMAYCQNNGVKTPFIEFVIRKRRKEVTNA